MVSISVLLPILLFIASSPSLGKSSEFSTGLSEFLDEENRSAAEIRPALGDGPWSWENPRPQGNSLRTVFVLAHDDVLAGGINTLMHWDGRDWRLATPLFHDRPASDRLIRAT